MAEFTQSRGERSHSGESFKEASHVGGHVGSDQDAMEIKAKAIRAKEIVREGGGIWYAREWNARFDLEKEKTSNRMFTCRV